MERVMSVLLWLVLGAGLVLRVACNAEGDCLNALKTNLADPNNVLGSWNSNDQSPCTWFNVTCNAHNSVIGVHLGSANISGQLVPELGQLENLQYLILYNNRISGNIPEEFGNLTNLVSLDLRFNDLNGSVPATLGKLTKLCILLLNNNSLSGEIPMSLTALMSLQILDLSNNQFTGAIPVNGSFPLFFPISLANNQNEQIILPPPTCPASAIVPAGLLAPSAGNSDSHVTRGGIAAFVTLGGIATFSVFLCSSIVILLLWSRRGRFQPRKPPNNFVNQPDIHLGQLQTFSFNELQAATDNFSDKNILGKGGFSKVYKGRLDDGSLVAVKRIEENRTQSTEQQFQTELQMISLAVHRNLLRPCGFCMTTTERLLVYPFMVNGSIASCVRDRPESQPPLDWKTRKRIALGVARGLAYLHDRCDPKIIHRDVKATNVFLDEEFEAVIGDFGLATLMGNEDTRVITAVCGTIGHIAPEYFSTGNPSEKTDVFAYGIMLLEVITKQRAFDLGRRANDEDVLLLDWVKRLLKEKKLETLVDSDLRDAHLQDEVEELIQLALLCTRAAPANRPQMSEVVRMLEGNGLAEKWEEWQQEEMACQDGNHTIHPSTHWVIENLSSITPDVLSGPR